MTANTKPVSQFPSVAGFDGFVFAPGFVIFPPIRVSLTISLAPPATTMQVSVPVPGCVRVEVERDVVGGNGDAGTAAGVGDRLCELVRSGLVAV